MDEREIRARQQRTRRYWVEDGLPELAMGLLLLYMGGFMLLSEAQRHSPVGQALGVLWIALGMSSFWLLKWIKGRTTFPRTGYAVPGWIPRGGEWGFAALVLALVAGSVWLGSQASGTSWAAAEPLLTPLAFAVGLSVGAVWLGVRRLAVVGLIGLLGAGTLFYAGVQGDRLSAGYCALMGCALVASGAVAFAGYRRRTQASPEA